MAYPSNVIHLATETSNKNHSATFPKDLPLWFIKLFTKEYDWVLDPFVGSGTTCEAAFELKRNSLGIDIVEEYIDMAKKKIPQSQFLLFEESRRYEKNRQKRAY